MQIPLAIGPAIGAETLVPFRVHTVEDHAGHLGRQFDAAGRDLEDVLLHPRTEKAGKRHLDFREKQMPDFAPEAERVDVAAEVHLARGDVAGVGALDGFPAASPAGEARSPDIDEKPEVAVEPRIADDFPDPGEVGTIVGERPLGCNENDQHRRQNGQRPTEPLHSVISLLALRRALWRGVVRAIMNVQYRSKFRVQSNSLHILWLQ